MAKLFNNRDTSVVDSTEWDAIIVGSGPSGLSCASMLGKYGNMMKILILEAHDEGVPGGCMHSFNCGGINFCSGVHYISIHGSSSAAVWKDLTDGQEWTDDLEGITDTLWIDGKPHPFNPNNWEEKWGFQKKKLWKLSKYFTWLVIVKILWYPFAVVAWFFFTHFGGKEEAEMDWGEWCKKQSGQDKINPIWYTESGGWGSVHKAREPGQSCALVAGAVARHYCNGISIVKGGYPETVRRMVKVCIERGATILTDAKVDNITFDSESGRATGVSVKGVELKAKRVIVSGAHALQNLSGKRCPKALSHAIKECGESAKHGVVFLAYKAKTAEELGLSKGVHWIDNKFFLSYKEQKSADGKIEGTGVYILWEMPYVKRGADYLEKKEEYSEAAKEYIFKMWPKLKDYDDEDSSTPATTEHYVQGRNGSSYGLDTPTKRFFDFDIVRALRPEQSELPGVYLTGQDSLMLGIAGGLSCGIITAQAILYPSVFDVIRGNNLMAMLIKEYKKKYGKTSQNKNE